MGLQKYSKKKRKTRKINLNNNQCYGKITIQSKH